MHPILLSVWIAAELSQPGTSFKQPQVAFRENFVGVTFGAANTIYFAGSNDRGSTFAEPVKVAETAKLALGSHRGPRLAYTRQAIVIAAGVGDPPREVAPSHDAGHREDSKTGSGGMPHGLTRLLTWRSTDGGKTWTARPRIDAGQQGSEGFVGLASDGKDTLHAVWIAPENKSVKLFGAISTDHGASWSRAKTIYSSPDGNVCECCHPSVTIGSSGEVLVMWRNSLGGARDLYLAISKDGGQTFTTSKLGEGTWPLNACPMDGGGIAERSGEVITVWRRNLDVFLARPGKLETKIGTGRNPAVAQGRQGVYALWSSPEGLMALLPGSGAAKVLAKQGNFPSITGGSQVVAAWEDGGKIRIEKLD